MMYPTPTFVMYSMYAMFTGMKAIAVPLREDFSFDTKAFVARMKKERPALVFIAYPNNPTGTLYPEADVVEVIRACEGVVVVDEAYHAFAGKTFMDRLGEFPNLVVMRTVSKLGLAGIRLGYLAASPAWSEQFNKVRSPYNVNVLTQAAAEFMLERLEVLEDQAAKIREEREKLGKDLKALKGVALFPSAANFFLIRVPDAARVDASLRKQGVLVKNLHPGIAQCLRVTVGTPDENRILLNALREALQ
jgi:histidinol-phosphate aminotransferase